MSWREVRETLVVTCDDQEQAREVRDDMALTLKNTGLTPHFVMETKKVPGTKVWGVYVTEYEAVEDEGDPSE